VAKSLRQFKPLSETEIQQIVAAESQDAIGNVGGLVSSQRETALKYYLGLPFGNEQDDRSQIVMTEVRDVLEGALPTMLKIFTSSDDVVRFEPQSPEDEQAAQQATDYINYIFYRKNPGFKILYTWFKDALLSKVGVVKWWWDENKDVTEESYNGLDDMGLAQLLADPDVEPIEHSAEPEVLEMMDPMTGQPQQQQVMTHSVKVKRTKSYDQARIANVPPEEFLISRDATDIMGARFVGHRVTKTVSELIAMGFDPDVVDQIPTEDQTYWSTEYIVRRQKDDEFGASIPQSVDPSQRRVTVVEGYYRMDADGDGIAELRQIWHGNLGTPILSNIMWDSDRPPFAALTPFPMPHRFFGLSLADMVQDLQLYKSTLLRQISDNIYFTTNARHKVKMTSPDSVNIDDVLSSTPGGIIRMKADGSDVEPVGAAPMPNFAYQLLEYLDTIKENRTGVTRYNQGLDADSLNQTATGVNQILNQAMDRLLLIARVFAETGVKDLFKGLLGLICQHQDKASVIRLRNTWVQMDPREWNRMDDITVHVGLGTGDKMESARVLTQLLAVQEKMAMAGNPGGMVRPKNTFNLLSEFAKAAGQKNIDQFFTDPDSPQAQETMQQQAQKPNPEMMKLQAEGQLRQQEMAMQQQTEQMKAQVQMQLAQHKAELDAQVAQAQQQSQQAQNNAQMQNDMAMAQFKANLDAQLQQWKAKLDAETKIIVAQISAKASVDAATTQAADQGLTDSLEQ